MKATRKKLIADSKAVRPLVEAGEFERVNDALMALYSDMLGFSYDRKEWNTFAGWKKNGYKVTKGSKSTTIWGSKRKAVQKDSEAETGASAEEKAEAKKFAFFPTCNLFHISQVEKAN